MQYTKFYKISFLTYSKKLLHNLQLETNFLLLNDNIISNISYFMRKISNRRNYVLRSYHGHKKSGETLIKKTYTISRNWIPSNVFKKLLFFGKIGTTGINLNNIKQKTIIKFDIK